MTIHAWRIVKAKHAGSAFSGEGAKAFGGRWNSPGVAMAYTAGSLSLAVLEMLVHLESQELLKHYVAFDVSFSDALVTTAEGKMLPRSWRKSPPPRAAQQVGDAWAAGLNSAILRVPSVIVPTEWNYLLNPGHRDFGKIRVGRPVRLELDLRLLPRR